MTTTATDERADAHFEEGSTAMFGIGDLSRRALLVAPALSALTASATACAEPGPAPRAGGSTMLVAYFTRSGNTRVISGTIQRALHTDLFEIRAAQPYPEDYEHHPLPVASHTSRAAAAGSASRTP